MVQVIFIPLLNVPEVKIVTTKHANFYSSSISGCDKFILTVVSIKSVTKWLLAPLYVSSSFSVLHTYNHMTTVRVWYAFGSHYYMADWHVLQRDFLNKCVLIVLSSWIIYSTYDFCYVMLPLEFTPKPVALYYLFGEFVTRFAESCSFCFTFSRQSLCFRCGQALCDVSFLCNSGRLKV